MENSSLPIGVLALLDDLPGTALTRYAQDIESLGYGSFWLPELFGREPMVTAAHLLAHTRSLVLATGIANVYVRDAHALAQAAQTLAELSGGRFILGLGVSNVGLNTARGHTWVAPLTRMQACLDALDAVTVRSVPPAVAVPRVLAAHGPALQRLGAARCSGILTYLMTAEHTRRSRERIGAGPGLTVVCAMLAESDPVLARRTARKALTYYLTLDYYHREWRKLGFTDADFADGGSDALIDAIVGWGDQPALEAHLAAHRAAGATRVLVLPLDADGEQPGMRTLQALAPGA